jgi:hypothetical protein
MRMRHVLINAEAPQWRAGPPRKNLPVGKRGGPSSKPESPTSQDGACKALTFHPLADIFPLLEGKDWLATKKRQANHLEQQEALYGR